MNRVQHVCLTVLLAHTKILKRINVQPAILNVQLALVLAAPNAFPAHLFFTSKAQLTHVSLPAIRTNIPYQVQLLNA